MSDRSEQQDGTKAGSRAGLADATAGRTTADHDKGYTAAYKAAQAMLGKRKGWAVGLADAAGQPRDEDL